MYPVKPDILAIPPRILTPVVSFVVFFPLFCCTGIEKPLILLPIFDKTPYLCSPFAGFRLLANGYSIIFKQKIREMQNYELMVIFTPVLSDDDFKAAQKKYAALVTDNGGEVLHNNPWGLKSLAYPIAKKTTGIYWVMEYKAPTNFNEKLKTQLLRDESVMRHMFTALDKYAVEYNAKKRSGVQAEPQKTEA
jgi:small subunit ribosomal protein S6